MKKLKRYKATKFKAKGSVYDKDAADYAVGFIENVFAIPREPGQESHLN